MMNQTIAESETREQQPPALRIPDRAEVMASEKLDPKQLRVEQVGKLLDQAYQGASTLKLKPHEQKDLIEDFPDDAIEIRGHDGLIFIPHILLRERLWKVFGPTEVAEIPRERYMRADTNEIVVDLVLMARGKFLSEACGGAKFYPNNPKTNFTDTVESAWSEAFRRCCKRINCGTAVWRPQYVRDWVAKNAVQIQGKWYKKGTEPKPLKFVRASRPQPPASTADPAVEAERWSEPIEAHRKTAEKEQDEDVPF